MSENIRMLYKYIRQLTVDKIKQCIYNIYSSNEIHIILDNDIKLPEHIILRDIHVILYKLKIDNYFELEFETLEQHRCINMRLLPQYNNDKTIADIITLLKLQK